MKYLSVVILFLLSATQLFGQDKSLIHKGNELYKQQKYKEAEDNYRKSVEKKSQDITGNFNLGDALYKQKKFADAGEQFNKLSSSPNNNKVLTAQAYHNLGNSYLENKKLEESIEAYKKALLNNPKDDETRYNLAYAQEKLKQQQQQNKQNQNNKNQDNKNQQNKDNKNQDKNKDNKDQNKQNQDKQNQDQKDQQNAQQKDKLSKEDAERMLEALNNDEKQTQDKLKNKKLKGSKLNITKDW
ncbi:tetratricopeptide repeat protein [Mucilaginibacter sp.]|uniref:tetratricopeptide repeat protein n=1 Tax=Mucilaginibacter sp. TaxID=1882438 RepID=UPI00284A0CBD|nr:tetratricopeptide repeat protein [Mucilaginibacter sp.]MDR3695983.1 tetratricopeptide repeat protein [Mucilaginibacter sp.]